jgi:hypothetical protein
MAFVVRAIKWGWVSLPAPLFFLLRINDTETDTENVSEKKGVS